MATFRTTIPEALEEWATEAIFMKYRDIRLNLIYPQVFQVETSQRAFEEKWEVSGLGTFALKPEGTPIPYDDPVQGNRTRVTHQTFALGFRVTLEMREDDRWDIIRRMPDDLADSARDHQERLAFGVYNDAFGATGAFTGLDGLSLCNTLHTSLKGGGLRSNQLAPGVDFGHAGMEDMLTQAELTVDEAGRFIPFEPKVLLIHPNNRHEASRVLESELEPGTADNQINTMRSSRTGTRIVVSPYLTDPDYWFLIDTGRHDVTWYTRKGVTPLSAMDDDTLDMKSTAHYRAGVGFWKWEGVFGSTPP